MSPSISKIQIPVLPWEILVDVLCRLPPKSLLRFRCVSKIWRSFIDSPDFVKMHLAQSLASRTNLSLILGFLGIYSIDFETLDSCKPLRPPFCSSDVSNSCKPLRPPFSSSDVSNSCNGLVLLLGQDQTPFLWNPSTRKYKTLPDSPVERPRGITLSSCYKRFGFGYIPEEDDYRVLRVVEFGVMDAVWIGSQAHVYSLKSNSWKRVSDYPYPLPRIRGWGVHVNGALHTVLSLHGENPREQSILGFDLRDERNYSVPKPEFLAKDLDLSVHDLADSLCLMGTRKNSRIDLWIMKEYGVRDSWTKLLSIAPPDIEPHSVLFPVAYSKRGDEVLLNCDDERLVWYNLRRKTTRAVRVSGIPFRFDAKVLVGSLVPLESGYCAGVDEIVRKPVRREPRKGKETRNRKRDDFLSEGFKLVL